MHPLCFRKTFNYFKASSLENAFLVGVSLVLFLMALFTPQNKSHVNWECMGNASLAIALPIFIVFDSLCKGIFWDLQQSIVSSTACSSLCKSQGPW